jgi:vitamin B12 transporter
MQKLFPAVFSLAVFLAPLAHAEQPTPPPDPRSPQEENRIVVRDEIVVTASGTPEKIESTPTAATIITRAEIERREARDVVDVLSEVPGIVASRTGSPGKVASIFTRGGNSTHTLVMWNGIKLNNPYFSGYNWGQLSTAGVEKIEVVPGPYSALYGADAVSGVVNILTLAPRDQLSADLEGGEKGLRNASLSAAKSGPSWALNGAYEHRSDDGFASNDDYHQNSILGAGSFKPATHISVGLLARHADYDLGVPRNANAAGTAFVDTPHRRESGNETQLGVPIHFDIGPVLYQVRLTSNERRDDFADPDDQSGFVSSTTRSRSRNASASAVASTALGTITVGGEVERSTVRDLNAFGTNLDDRKRSDNAFFLEDRLSIHRANLSSLELSLGLRHDEFNTYGGETSPRIAAAWIRNGIKLRVGYGKAFRAPYLGELYFPFGGNPNLQAEHTRSAEIGVDRYFGQSGSVSVTAFDDRFQNLIVYDVVSNGFANVGAATSRGVEVGATRRWSTLSIRGSYTVLDTNERSKGRALLRRPRNSGSLAIGNDAGAFQSELVVLYKGARQDITDLFPYNTLTNSSYTTADIVFHYRLGDFSPYLKIENLTNEKYEDVFGYPSATRRASVGVLYTLGR